MACSKHGEDEKRIKNSGRKREGERSTGRSSQLALANTAMNLLIASKGVTSSAGGRQTASHEGFCSVEFSSPYIEYKSNKCLSKPGKVLISQRADGSSGLKFSVVFVSLSTLNLGYNLKLGHDHFLLQPFHYMFTIILPLGTI